LILKIFLLVFLSVFTSILITYLFLYKVKVKNLIVKKKIENTINDLARFINAEVGLKLLPDNITIKWIDDVDQSFLMKNNNIFIRLERMNCGIDELIKVVQAYLISNFSDKMNQYVDEDILKLTELMLIEDFFRNSKINSEASLFIIEKLGQWIEMNREIEPYYELFNRSPSSRRFLYILLHEITRLQKSGCNVREDIVRKEIRDFLNFLLRVAKKRPNEKIRLVFKGNVIRSALLLVSKKWKFDDNYIRRCITYGSYLLSNGIKNLHILAIGRSNTQVARLVANEIAAVTKASTVLENIQDGSWFNAAESSCFSLYM